MSRKGFGCLIALFCAWVLDASGAPSFKLFNAGAALIQEGSSNNVIEPNELITLRLHVKNIGSQKASNVVAAIQASSSVMDPFPDSQPYGAIDPSTSGEGRDFSFTVGTPNDELLTVVLDLRENGAAAGSITYKFRVGPTVTSLANSTTMRLPVVGPADLYPSTIAVSNLLGTVVKAAVTLSNVTHVFPDDLDILLVSPAGDPVMLMSDGGEGSSISSKNITFTVDATNTVPDGPGIIVSPVRASNYGTLFDPFFPPAPPGPFATTLAAVGGRNPNGNWRLFVVDDEQPDDGRIDGWSLTLWTYTGTGQLRPTVYATRRGDEDLRLRVVGEGNQSYAIEVSNDLSVFQVLHTFTMPATGEYVYDYEAGSGNEFFRALAEP